MDGSTAFLSVATAATTVELLDNAARADWAAYVLVHPNGSPFHDLAWRDAVVGVLGYDAPYLIARREGQVVGILPLIHLKTRLFGNAMVSTAFSVGGGILADDDDAAGALADEAVRIAKARRADCVELRSETARFASWPTKSKTYAGHVARIDPDPETRLAAIPRKKRADVRKGIKAGFTVDTDTTVDVFHDLYARNLHALGTPILPKKWYAALKEQFGDSCEISSVVVQGKPVVGLMSFFYKDTIYPYYVGALPEARRLHAFDYVYWSLMQRAAERGYKRFDFGRSKIGTGAADYKKHWGFEGVPLAYQFHLVGESKMPDVNPNNPKYARFVKAWKKLPFGVTKLVGPYLARQLG